LISFAPVFSARRRFHLWQTLSWAMQELPHGFPLVQCADGGPMVRILPSLSADIKKQSSISVTYDFSLYVFSTSFST
jgi:hypothetical protein